MADAAPPLLDPEFLHRLEQLEIVSRKVFDHLERGDNLDGLSLPGGQAADIPSSGDLESDVRRRDEQPSERDRSRVHVETEHRASLVCDLGGHETVAAPSLHDGPAAQARGDP